jgi:carotenoid cleavage dioxygenase
MSTPAATSDENRKPFHLRGNYAPVLEEVESFDLEVEGTIPPSLDGFLVRNGPNPKTGDSQHWFFGDGMLHAVEFEAGKAKTYRNRWVRTRQFLEDAQAVDLETGTIDRTVGASNTHIYPHAGKLLALVESGFPVEVDCNLQTVGVHDFDGKLTTAMTAHPKTCPKTGEMHFFGYSFAEPHLVYHCTDKNGQLIKTEVIEGAGPSMIHDFAITENFVVFMDLPIVFDLETAMRGTMPYLWNDDYPARVGVMPREGTGAETKWYELKPCYAFHSLNAYDDGNTIVMDICRYEDMWRGDASAFTPSYLHRWTINRETGHIGEQQLDDRVAEFPRIDDRLTGQPHRYGYAAWAKSTVASEATALVKYDLKTGESCAHEFGAGRSPSEGVFVADSESAGEDEGWLLTYLYDKADNASEVVVLDAQNPTNAPVARVKLPQRVPFGFHGCWAPRTG